MNYITIIEQTYPGVQVSSTDAEDYNSIDWGNESIIDKAILDADWLDIYKNECIVVMSQSAQDDIVDGFSSAALGGSPEYIYDSAPEDQLNMIGSAAAGDDMYYPCRIDGVKTYLFHTHTQLQTVVQDGRDVKLGILQTFTTKKQQILDATTEAEVDAITW